MKNPHPQPLSQGERGVRIRNCSPSPPGRGGWGGEGSGRRSRRSVFVPVLLLFAAPVARAACDPDGEALWRHRNLGKAFYENPATQYEAIGEFEKALALCPDSVRERVNYGLALVKAGQSERGIAELEKAQEQDPTIPHTWFNLGVAYKQNSEYAKATAQFERMVELAPDEPISHYNLGVLYKLDGRAEEAVRLFERAARLDPNLAGPHFQLATAYRQARRADDAKRAMDTFREIKARAAGDAVPEDLEWSYYAEIYETIAPARAAGPPAAIELAPRTLAEGLDPASAGLAVIDLGGDGASDLLAWSARGIEIFVRGEKRAASGLEELRGVVDAAPGDFDNDGLADLAVVTRSGAALYRQQDGRFVKVDAPLPSRTGLRKAVWLDYDHEYDLDLFLLGERSALFRNEGEAGWSDRTADFPFVDAAAVDAARLDVVADTQGMDLAVLYADRDAVLYRDRLAGRYEPVTLEGLKATTIAALDVDHDGWTDLAASGADGVALFVNDRRGGFPRETAVAGDAFVFADLENRGMSDLVTSGAVHRNQGRGELAAPRSPAGLPQAAVLAAADFDADGRVDLAAVDADGSLVVLGNRTSTANRWLSVSLTGVKNPALAPGAEVEVKAGRRYQKKAYDGTPLHFGLGSHAEVDTVRITWPNGLIQNEARQPTGQAHAYREAQRLSGSCPMIFTWNGREFEFITDVLGVAPLGASAGDGEYFPVDHDEVIQIPGEALAAEDGVYEVRVTEELREVAFLDEIRLVAVDHPEDVDVLTNDKFKGPPFPEFKLFGVRERVRPLTARDHRGQDVRERLLARDRTYPDGFARDDAGVAELHHLELDFGEEAGDAALLVLSGWVEWADGSTFLNASQQSDAGLVFPYLQVKDEEGRWRTVIDDMGIPAGKPKTIVVDMTDKFLSRSREVRIVTNLCVYWDEIFLAPQAALEPRLTDLHARDAELRFRGFSRVVIHPERKQPERFVYADLRPTSMWNPTPGLYTRYGDVRPLLGAVDDRFVIMGSGDELRLRFDAAALPALPAGWRRDFLLFVDGWAKDGDANTAHSQTVEPLPYHGMPQYPYEAPHRYPDGGAHNLYREHYNTRPALRLIRPLTEGSAP